MKISFISRGNSRKGSWSTKGCIKRLNAMKIQHRVEGVIIHADIDPELVEKLHRRLCTYAGCSLNSFKIAKHL